MQLSILSILSIIVGSVLLAFLIFKIVEETRDNFENQQEDPYVLSLVKEIRTIDPSVDAVADKLKFYEGKKSYTINKSHVFLCLKDREGSIYRKNQLVLVLIHEISHALCDEVGHTARFNQIFEDLLEKASKKGIYNPNIPNIQDYCEY